MDSEPIELLRFCYALVALSYLFITRACYAQPVASHV